MRPAGRRRLRHQDQRRCNTIGEQPHTVLQFLLVALVWLVRHEEELMYFIFSVLGGS